MLTILLSTLLLGQTVRITDFGAVADNQTDCSPAFYKAYEALKSQLNPAEGFGGTIVIPAASKFYLTKTPIVIEHSFIKVQGEGRDVSKVWNVGEGPVFIFGLRQSEEVRAGTIGISEEHRPLRRLDASLGGRAVRLRGNTTIGYTGTPADLGPQLPGGSGTTRFDGTEVMVVEMAISRHDDPSWSGGTNEGIISLGGYGVQPTFTVNVGGGRRQLDFIFTDNLGRSGSLAAFFDEPVPDPLRLTLQIDLRNKTGSVWANKVQVRAVRSGTAWNPPESTFKPNEYSAFIVGANSNSTDGRVPAGGKTPDITFHGLSASTYKKYIDGTVGSLQQSVSGTPVNDAFMYSIGDGGKCLFALWDQDTQPRLSRLVKTFTGSNGFRIFYGYQLHNNQGSLVGWPQGNSVDNVELRVVRDASPVLQTVGVLNFTLKNARIRGGSQGFSTVHSTASYPTRIEATEFACSDANIFAAWSVVRARDLQFQTLPRYGVLSWASDIRVSDVFCAFGTSTSTTFASAYAGLYGGHHSYKGIDIDFEGETLKSAGFYIEQFPNLHTSLNVEDVYFGSSVNGKPAVLAKTVNKSWPFGIFLNRLDTLNGKPSRVYQANDYSIGTVVQDGYLKLNLGGGVP